MLLRAYTRDKILQSQPHASTLWRAPHLEIHSTAPALWLLLKLPLQLPAPESLIFVLSVLLAFFLFRLRFCPLRNASVCVIFTTSLSFLLLLPRTSVFAAARHRRCYGLERLCTWLKADPGCAHPFVSLTPRVRPSPVPPHHSGLRSVVQQRRLSLTQPQRERGSERERAREE